MLRIGRCVAFGSVAGALALAVPSAAVAAEPQGSWWTQSGSASAVLDSDVPPDGLLVQSSPAGEFAISAVTAAGSIGTLAVRLSGNPVMSAPLRACRLTGAFTPVRGGAWVDRPPYDCTGAVEATQSGAMLAFALNGLHADGVVIVAGGTADRVVLGAPKVVLVAAAETAPTATASPQPGPAPVADPVTPVEQPGTPALPAIEAPQPVPVGPVAPVPAPDVAEMAPAVAAPVTYAPVAVSGSSTRRVAGTVVAVALLLALLVYWSDGFGAGAWRSRRPGPLATQPVSEVPMTEPDMSEVVRTEVRRQLAAGPRRYAPLAVATAALLALVVLVPDARPGDGTSSLGATSGDGEAVPGTTTGGVPGTTTGTVPGTTPGRIGGTTTGVVPGTAGSTGSTTGTTGGTSSTSTTGVVQPKANGIAINGTRCEPGVRQFTFVPYSPMCLPKFTGDNGGATAHGVTKSTITFILRNPTDYDAGRSAVAASTYAEALHDTQVMVKVFNKQFELYGRQVIVKTFTGRGSFIAEAAGQDQAGANADAQTAYDMGAFASGIPPDPQVYQDALSARGIISFGLNAVGTVANSRKAYPYQYQSLGPMPDFLATGMADLVCGRMAKMPAVFAGDPLLAKKTRTFGMVLSQQAADAEGGTNKLPSLVKAKCGQTVRTYTYRGNPATNASDGSSIATRAKSDGVTTLILASDLLFGPSMTNAAVQQSYQPEWLVPTLNRNQTARQMNATALRSMVFAHPWKAQNFAPNKGSCYRIYKMGDPHGEPQSDGYAGATFDSNCALLLEFFGALQAAGPRLTPATFGRGFFSLPPSSGSGDFGRWSYAKDHFSPDSTYTLQYWRPSGTNPYDGGTGSYVDCREPADIPYLGAKVGTGQLRCLAR